MTILTICPCCSNTMLHYVGNHRDYWFCRSCWQEMPNLAEIDRSHHQVEKPSLFTGQNVTVNRKKQIDDLSVKLQETDSKILV